MVSSKEINYGSPPVRQDEQGGTNVVLALHSKDYYSANGSNSYLPRWAVVNAMYYNLYSQDYEGWIELEDLPAFFP